MNTLYSYKNIPLSNIIVETTNSDPYYANMSEVSTNINPIVESYPFGYTSPVTTSTRSYRQAAYTDFTSSNSNVTIPSGATHFLAILIGQGGQGGGGGGGFFNILDGYKSYYSGQQGSNGTAGSVTVSGRLQLYPGYTLSVTVGNNTILDNQGSTGVNNRNNVTNSKSGTKGQDGAATKLTHHIHSLTASGGTGGSGGTGTWAGNDYSPTNTGKYATLTYSFNNNTYDSINAYTVNTTTRNGVTENIYSSHLGIGGDGGWGYSDYYNPSTAKYPEKGFPGGSGFARIYWFVQ